jgi:uncharacterized membrane protein HdeD (DUF308 family)
VDIMADSTGRGGTVGRRGLGGWTLPQQLAAAIGAIYLLVGLLGFAVTGFDDFAEHTGESLLGFHVNPLHNIVHIVIGALGLAMSRRLASARTYGWILFAGYALAFLYGLWAVNNPENDFLNINWADNVLHIVSALAGLAIALLPVRDRITGGRA